MGKDILKKEIIIYQNLSYYKNLRAFSLVILIPGSKEFTRDVGYATRHQMTIYMQFKSQRPFQEVGKHFRKSLPES
jgi:hypothetical protein